MLQRAEPAKLRSKWESTTPKNLYAENVAAENVAGVAAMAAMAAIDIDVAAVLHLELDNEAQEQAELGMKERVTATNYNKTLLNSQKEICGLTRQQKQPSKNRCLPPLLIRRVPKELPGRHANLCQFLIGRRQAIGSYHGSNSSINTWLRVFLVICHFWSGTPGPCMLV